MKIMKVAKLKANFSQVLKDLERGEEIVIEFGKGNKKLGVIVPFEKYEKKKRKVGILENKGSYEIVGDFKITDEELASL